MCLAFGRRRRFLCMAVAGPCTVPRLLLHCICVWMVSLTHTRYARTLHIISQAGKKGSSMGKGSGSGKGKGGKSSKKGGKLAATGGKTSFASRVTTKM